MDKSIVRQLERFAEESAAALDELESGHLYSEEAYALMGKINTFLQANLETDSKEFRIFDKLKGEISQWKTVERSSNSSKNYASTEERTKLRQWDHILRELLAFSDPEFLRDFPREKTQFFLPSDDAYRAKKLFWKLMKKAQKSIVVVDEYLDDEIFDYIESLEANILIQLLTGRKKPIFKTLYEALKSQRGNLEARENQACHDRYLIIDDNEVWHSGNSFNGIGKKAFQVNKLNDENERQKYLNYFQDWWSNSSAL